VIPAKAKEKLGWTPTTTLEELVAEMVATDQRGGQERGLFEIERIQCGGIDGESTNEP